MSSRLHMRILDRLGGDIAAGRLTAGTILRVADLSGEFDVSLPVMREAVRVLQAAGLISLTKRVGLRVLPESEWNALDPLVIRWRLESPDKEAFLRSLIELRRVVEPEAARLAAQRGSAAEREQLLEAAHSMLAASVGPEKRAAYFEADVRFHSILMGAGENPVFRSLRPAVIEALRGRTGMGLEGEPVDPAEAELHVTLAEMVAQGDAAGAETAGRQLLGGIERRLRG